MRTHVRVEPGPVATTSTTESTVCFCACPICMSGSCCQLPKDAMSIAWPTTVTTGTSTPTWRCGAIDHDFVVLDPSRIYCRKCGETRTV